MSSKEINKFYKSDEWQIFRQSIILDRGTRCEICHKTIIESRHIHIHHTPIELTDDNYKDVNIALNPDNVKLVCHRCHNKEHNRFCGQHFERKEKSVYIVYGPPLSGKTSYVLENKTENDIVIDMDRLYQAVSLNDMYDKPDKLKYNVLGIRNYLIDCIKTRYGNWYTAWIIGGYADKYVREKLAKDLGAAIIFLDISQEDCIYRLKYCNDYRQEHQDEWIKYINAWFESYTK